MCRELVPAAPLCCRSPGRYKTLLILLLTKIKPSGSETFSVGLRATLLVRKFFGDHPLDPVFFSSKKCTAHFCKFKECLRV